MKITINKKDGTNEVLDAKLIVIEDDCPTCPKCPDENLPTDPEPTPSPNPNPLPPLPTGLPTLNAGEFFGKHQAFRWSSQVGSVIGGMWVYLPPGYSSSSKFALLINLHGIGQVGADNGTELSKANDVRLVELLNTTFDLPMIVVSPQASYSLMWSSSFIHEIINLLRANFSVEDAKIYLMGFSLGGYGTWEYSVEHPEMISACVPMAGGVRPDLSRICRMKDVPTWAFHGEFDDVVDVSNSVNAINALKQCGGNAEQLLTIWQGYSHYGWTEVYEGRHTGQQTIYEWLLSKSKTGSTPVPTPTPTPVPTPTSSPTSSVGMSMGMNLEFINYWNTGLPFINHMKYCGAGGQPQEPWVSITLNPFVWGNGQTLDLDTNGYVKSLKANQIAGTISKSGFSGRYVLKWDGNGTLSVDGAGNSSNGRLVFDKGINQDIGIQIRSVDPTNYPKNIKLCLEQHENSTEDFNPEYLDKLKHFSCLRFMDWMRTNNSQVQNASSLIPKSYVSQGLRVSLDHIIDLCNLLHKDCWINVPHLATDALVAEMATQFANKLDPTLKLFVEYSNECWNGIFAQTAYVERQAFVDGVSAGTLYDAGQMWYGRRSKQVMDIFSSKMDQNRLVRVFAHQNGNQYHTTMALNFENNHQAFDALAIAPYFGRPIRLSEQSALQQQGKQFVLGMCQQQIDETTGYARDSKDVANQFGLDLITYEGGQHFLASPDIHNTDLNNQIIMEVQRDPAMKSFYLDYLAKLNAAGVSLFNHFTFIEQFNKWSMFGALESIQISRTISPKWDALLSFLGK